MDKLSLLLAAPLLLANAAPEDIPPGIRAMLESAMAGGNADEVAAIAKHAARAAPDSAGDIRKLAAEWKRARDEAEARTLREADLLELVTGRAELGGYLTSGNSENTGLNAAIDVQREGLSWRHKLRLQAEYQEDSGDVTRERYLAAYEPNWKIDDRAYVYGAAQFESDRFSGFDERYSLSVGAGYTVIKQPDLTLDVELGPAFRTTYFTDDTAEESIALRGSTGLVWKLLSTVSFRQDASAYVQRFNSTLSARSALQMKLLGPLSAQLSYVVQYESDPPAGRESTDTTTRGALIVDF